MLITLSVYGYIYFFSFYKHGIVIYFMGVCHKDNGVIRPIDAVIHTCMRDRAHTVPINCLPQVTFDIRSILTLVQEPLIPHFNTLSIIY